MLKNYLVIAWRNLRAKKGFSFINITGLAIGMAAALLIGLWAQNELSYDNFHFNKNSLYKVWNRSSSSYGTFCWDVTASPMGETLQKDYPAIRKAARIYWSIDRLFDYGDKSLKAKGNDVDPPFLSMFTFPLLEGNAEHALEEKNSIVLTEHLARKIFGSEEPMNKLIKVNDKDLYKVTGVLKELPNNTTFDFEYLVSLESAKEGYGPNSWSNNSYYTFVQLQPGFSGAQVDQQIKDIFHRYDPTQKTEVFLHPISQWHLYSRFENGRVAGGRIEIVRLFLLIGGLILLIACINFMNLSTAQSQKRAREVGVRKVMGAGKLGLVSQFLGEAVLIAGIAGLAAIAIAQVSLPAFNELTGKSLTIDYGSPLFWGGFAVFILFNGLVAGSYPAFFLSTFNPVKVLKGSFKNSGALFTPRRVLVVLQFSIAIILMVSTFVVYRQLQYAQNRDTGYNIKDLVQVPIEGTILKNYTAIQNDLLNTGAATSLCKASYDVTVNGATSAGFTWDSAGEEQKQIEFTRYATGGDFVKTMGLTLVDGRDIDLVNHPTDTGACLLNEAAIKSMHMKNPVGKYIKGARPNLIVGVFKNFIIKSPYENVDPMIVYGSPNWAYSMIIRLNKAAGNAKSLQLMGSVFKKYNPAYPFTYHFVDRQYEEKYNDQKQTGALAGLFAGLTIVISCLGLFGLAAYMAENRSREIGIRKVLGASAVSITRMLTKEFIILVGLAILIATPVAQWVMSKWLQGFTYRIQIGWGTYLVIGMLAIFIALLTVSTQAIKAALSNPVDSIRTSE